MRRLQNNLRRSSRFFFSSSSSSLRVLRKLCDSEERVGGLDVFEEFVLGVGIIAFALVVALAFALGFALAFALAFALVVALVVALFPFSFPVSFADSSLSTLATLSAFFNFKLIACILLNSPVFLTDVGLIFVVTLSPSVLCTFLPIVFSSPIAISAPLAHAGRAGSAYPCWFASKNRSISPRSASTPHPLSPPQRHDCMRR